MADPAKPSPDEDSISDSEVDRDEPTLRAAHGDQQSAKTAPEEDPVDPEAAVLAGLDGDWHKPAGQQTGPGPAGLGGRWIDRDPALDGDWYDEDHSGEIDPAALDGHDQRPDTADVDQPRDIGPVEIPGQPAVAAPDPETGASSAQTVDVSSWSDPADMDRQQDTVVDRDTLPVPAQAAAVTASGAGPRRWLLGAVIFIAAGLLLAGGIGVMEERRALQQEIRDLQARLAVAVPNEQLQSDLAELNSLSEENAQLSRALDSARTENTRLGQSLAELRADFDGLQAQLTSAAPAIPVDTESPTPAAAEPSGTAADDAAVAESAAALESDPPFSADDIGTTATRWFVNFGSYGQRAIAENWSKRLQVEHGDIVVLNALTDSGELFRVRVVNLASQEQARAVAAALEATHGLPPLWIGTE